MLDELVEKHIWRFWKRDPVAARHSGVRRNSICDRQSVDSGYCGDEEQDHERKARAALYHGDDDAGLARPMKTTPAGFT